MGAIAKPAIWFVAALTFAPSSAAFETELRLDPASFIHQFGPEREAQYSFPGSARIRLVFGARSGDSIPVTIPQDGLVLGVAKAQDMPPLEFRLAEPARGTLRVDGDGEASLSVAAKVLVKRVGGLRSTPYDLNLSVDVVRIGQTAKGWMQIAAADEVARGSSESTESFTALIAGKLDALPSEFE